MQYLEEPVKAEDFEAFTDHSLIPIALDETLDEVLRQAESEEEALMRLESLLMNPRLSALVVKPSLLPWGPSFAITIAKFAYYFSEKHESHAPVKVCREINPIESF